MVITNYSREKLSKILINSGEKSFRAIQIFEWIYKKQITSFANMQNISSASIATLENLFSFNELRLEDVQTSSDGTKKYLFALKDSFFIETVHMRFNYGESVCISTQVGCNMACRFCASGQKKALRNLEVWEMVAQVLYIDNLLRKENKRISHVVIMGIGEPFDNYENVMEFIKIINDGKGLDIGARHITVSTSGIVPKIKEFSDFPLQVNLAISLHFPNNSLRSKYMPINRLYPLDELIAALHEYYEKTKRRITFEYVLIAGINDTQELAYELASLIRPFNCYVNLIPLNTIGVVLKRSSKEATDTFFNILVKEGIKVTIRREQGADIDAACGQLRSKREVKNAGTSN